LSWVRGNSHAQFCGEGVIAISPPYPTRYGRSSAGYDGLMWWSSIAPSGSPGTAYQAGRTASQKRQ
jgi:hypothetical protein